MLTASLHSGGAETHIAELATSLAERSHTVFIASAGGSIAASLVQQGIRHIPIPLDSKSPKCLLLSVNKLKKLIKHEHFDLIHVHSRIAAFICRLAVGKRTAPTIVSTVHARFRTSPFLKKLSFWGEASITVSDDLKEYLSKEYKVSKEKITVIPNAIDTKRFSPNRKKTSGTKIIFVSRLDTDCSLGAKLLCRIAPDLAKKYKELKIEIVGGGKEYKRLSVLAQKTNAAVGYDCISLCGHVKKVEDKLSQADVFVGVSRAALEAMSCAVPTVLCGNEGFLGLLDSSNMALAASGNFCCRDSELPTSVSLFKAISTALEMKESGRRALGEYLRDYVCKHHSSEMLARRTEAFYLNAITKNPKTSGGIVLCGYYGFGNLGDDAILAAAISRIRKEYPDKPLTVICHSPKKTSIKFGVRTVSRENVLRCAKEIKKAQLLIFGGGSVLQNSSSMRSLIYYTSLIRYAARHGVKVRLLSNGLGPIDGKRAKKHTARALSLCSSLSFRDKSSAALARSLGCDPSKITLERDLSAALKECEPNDAEQLIDICGLKGQRYFLVALHKKSDKSTKKLIDKEVDALKRGGLLPVFIAMHSVEDPKINKKASRRHSGIYIEGLEPAELLTLIKRADFAIGNRYHLLFLAKNEGVPIQVFGDDPKLVSLRYENYASFP